MTLPDCMMPDGAEPCVGYLELQEENKALKAEVASYSAAMMQEERRANALQEENKALKAELEQERVRLAGVTTALDGHISDCKQGDYGWSLPYQMAVERMSEREALKAEVGQLLKDRDMWKSRSIQWKSRALQPTKGSVQSND